MEKEKVIYALGCFDGVHLGHQALLQTCRELAEKHGCKAGVLTFHPHPEALLLGEAPKLINSIDDRKRLLFGHGAEMIWEMPFDEDVKNISWDLFLTLLLNADAAGFVCGSDFRFGAGGEGTAEKLAAFCQEKNLPYAVVPQQELQGVRISSSHIRKLLENGDMLKVADFLGHPHILTGQVVAGRGLGHTIGVPTANVRVAEDVLLPKNGVYACGILVGEESYTALTNVGSRPTVEGQHITVESWLLDFEGDLYGQEVTLIFLLYLRPEQKFDSLEELKAQIQKDAEKMQEIFAEE